MTKSKKQSLKKVEEENNKIDKITIITIIVILLLCIIVGITVGKILFDLAMANA